MPIRITDFVLYSSYSYDKNNIFYMDLITFKLSTLTNQIFNGLIVDVHKSTNNL